MRPPNRRPHAMAAYQCNAQLVAEGEAPWRLVTIESDEERAFRLSRVDGALNVYFILDAAGLEHHLPGVDLHAARFPRRRQLPAASVPELRTVASPSRGCTRPQ